ncbi:MAG TPA: GTP pyrophosphokinase, partial [Fusobacterium ulcerans]|nr:GTP pyrophosphokinase [Fusobacterium ulcerans]
PIITEYLGIFNRIVGSADEMGTFIKNMKSQFTVHPGEDTHYRELDNKFK